MQRLTSDTSSEEAGAAASDHGPHHQLGQVTTAPGGHGTQSSQVDANGTYVAEATQCISGNYFCAFLVDRGKRKRLLPIWIIEIPNYRKYRNLKFYIQY